MLPCRAFFALVKTGERFLLTFLEIYISTGSISKFGYRAVPLLISEACFVARMAEMGLRFRLWIEWWLGYFPWLSVIFPFREFDRSPDLLPTLDGLNSSSIFIGLARASGLRQRIDSRCFALMWAREYAPLLLPTVVRRFPNTLDSTLFYFCQRLSSRVKVSWLSDILASTLRKSFPMLMLRVSPS